MACAWPCPVLQPEQVPAEEAFAMTRLMRTKILLSGDESDIRGPTDAGCPSLQVGGGKGEGVLGFYPAQAGLPGTWPQESM